MDVVVAGARLRIGADLRAVEHESFHRHFDADLVARLYRVGLVRGDGNLDRGRRTAVLLRPRCLLVRRGRAGGCGWRALLAATCDDSEPDRGDEGGAVQDGSG